MPSADAPVPEAVGLERDVVDLAEPLAPDLPAAPHAASGEAVVTRDLAGLASYVGEGTAQRRPEEGTTFEASCYTDPLALAHLTGSWQRAQCRVLYWT